MNSITFFRFFCGCAAISLLYSCCKPKALTDCHQAVINSFVNAKQQDLWLPPAIGTASSGTGGFFAFQNFSVENNNYKSSIEVSGNCNNGKIYLGWMDINANLQPKWYEYSYANCDGNFSFKFLPESNLKSPTYPYYMSVFHNTTNERPRPTGAWCEYDDYDAWYIPHWSPIIDGKHDIIDDLHTAYSNSQASDVQDYLNAAKPKNGEDLEDRTLTGWESVTLRGIVQSADHPYGDLDVDHLKACKETYGGIPAEIVYPEKGADWDMYIKPDPDMGYLATDAKKTTVGCEIEDWTLRDDNHVYRPKAGDYLQTIGKWSIDCGHALNNDLNNGFFTEIHPPEILVSSKYAAGVTNVKVLGTGAFKNNSHSFVVWPGPRPSANHELRYELFDEQKQNMSLEISAVPAQNPNHLVCRLLRTGGDALQIDDEGVVYQRCEVIYKAKIKAYWKRKLLSTDFVLEEMVQRFKGIKFRELSASAIKKLGENDGYFKVNGQIHGRQTPYKGQVKIKKMSAIANKISSDQEFVAINNLQFKFDAEVGEEYLIEPLANNGLFRPQNIVLKIDEKFIENENAIHFEFEPNPEIDKLSLVQLQTRVQRINGVNDAVAKRLAKILIETEDDGIFFKTNLLQPASGFTIENWGGGTLKENLQNPKPFYILNKKEGSYQILMGNIETKRQAFKARIQLYAGDDSLGYALVHEQELAVDAERDVYQLLSNKPYFEGRIKIDILDAEGINTMKYSVLSKKFSGEPSRQRNAAMLANNFSFVPIPLNQHPNLRADFQKEEGEFLTLLNAGFSGNKKLQNQKERRMANVK